MWEKLVRMTLFFDKLLVKHVILNIFEQNLIFFIFRKCKSLNFYLNPSCMIFYVSCMKMLSKLCQFLNQCSKSFALKLCPTFSGEFCRRSRPFLWFKILFLILFKILVLFLQINNKYLFIYLSK